jgi:prephenate dehydrogenase
VMDLGSTKAAIMETMQQLPERFDPVGGHPMCGRERSGFACADRQLFKDAAFAFTPLERTSSTAMRVMESMANLLGAHPLWMEPVMHDEFVAATSHLPYLLANALATATPHDATQLAGPGFRSTSRLAGSSVEMMMDIMTTNREYILGALERFDGQLEQLYDLLLNRDYDSMQTLLAQGADKYRTILDKIDEGTTQ